MKLNNIEHIFFDLDHTLWDFDKNSGLAFHAIFRKNKIEVELEKFLEIYTPININYWKLYSQNKVTQSELRYLRLKESFELLKILVDDEQINLIATDYIDYLPRHNFLLKGAEELLDYLQKQYHLHIITNGFKLVQHRKLQNSGIADYFKTVTTSEDAGAKKPNKSIFEHALQKAGATISNSVMIGDNLEADIFGAEEIGMKAILYNYYKKEFSPKVLQVLKMKEIAAYL